VQSYFSLAVFTFWFTILYFTELIITLVVLNGLVMQVIISSGFSVDLFNTLSGLFLFMLCSGHQQTLFLPKSVDSWELMNIVMTRMWIYNPEMMRKTCLTMMPKLMIIVILISSTTEQLINTSVELLNHSLQLHKNRIMLLAQSNLEAV